MIYKCGSCGNWFTEDEAMDIVEDYGVGASVHLVGCPFCRDTSMLIEMSEQDVIDEIRYLHDAIQRMKKEASNA